MNETNRGGKHPRGGSEEDCDKETKEMASCRVGWSSTKIGVVEIR
jgi:hypothetical protein